VTRNIPIFKRLILLFLLLLLLLTLRLALVNRACLAGWLAHAMSKAKGVEKEG
jgi:hypothetical protein